MDNIFSIPLICKQCGDIFEPVAEDTDEGYFLTLDCSCRSIYSMVYFDLPEEVEPTLDNLINLGFEII